jgi:hypothetical protein
VDSMTAERVGRNEATFRDANERIVDSAREYEVDERIPFLCECADPSCTAIVRLDGSEYERIRADSTWFFNAPGHSLAAAGYSQVIETHPGYEIAVKLGRAAEVAEQLDPETAV